MDESDLEVSEEILNLPGELKCEDIRIPQPDHMLLWTTDPKYKPFLLRKEK